MFRSLIHQNQREVAAVAVVVAIGIVVEVEGDTVVAAVDFVAAEEGTALVAAEVAVAPPVVLVVDWGRDFDWAVEIDCYKVPTAVAKSDRELYQ